MKHRICHEVWMKESKKQQERLARLYGQASYEDVAEKFVRKKLRKSMLLLGLIVFLALISVFHTSTYNDWIRLDDHGNLTSIIRPERGEASVIVEAEAVSEAGVNLTPQGVRFVVTPQNESAKEKTAAISQTENRPEDALRHEIRKTVYQINNDSVSKQVLLPDQLPDGTKIQWVPHKGSSNYLIFIVLFISGLFIFSSRDAELVRLEKTSKESVLRDLPEFVNKLVLMLDAGLVMRTAFQKVVSEHNKRTGGVNDYFYSQLSQIMTKCNETNSSIQDEIRNFAIRTGIVEFMRLSNIINDSMIKGSDLMIQLRLEGDNLWATRRKHMEEKGKLAESKLTFPLMILLLVLVMITIAPAMMEM